MAELDHAESTVKLYLSCALLAPRRPSCARDLRRERREEITASSERAKKPLRAIRTNTTATSDMRCVRPCPAVRSSWLLKALEDSMPDALGSGMTVSRTSPVQCLPDSRTRPSLAQIKFGQHSLRWRLLIASRGDADSLGAGAINHRFAFKERSVIQAGAWSLAPSWPRTERSTRASFRRNAMSGLRRRWSSLSPASRSQRLRK